MSNKSSSYVAVCGDCTKQLSLSDTEHVCLPMRYRQMMDLMESNFEACDDGLGTLWLVRIMYRERCKMSGIGKYKDRADLARRVCRLIEGNV